MSTASLDLGGATEQVTTAKLKVLDPRVKYEA